MKSQKASVLPWEEHSPSPKVSAGCGWMTGQQKKNQRQDGQNSKDDVKQRVTCNTYTIWACSYQPPLKLKWD